MELLRVDQALLGRWHAIVAAALDHDLDRLPADPIEEHAAVLGQPADAPLRTEQWLAVADGTDLAAAELRLPQRDNLEEASLDLRVAPDLRRRGHGRDVLDRLERRAHELGRTRLLAEVPGRLDGVQTPGERFAAAAGYAPQLAEVRRVLDVADLPDLDALEAAARPAAQAYALHPLGRRAPEAALPGLAALAGRMSLDSPQGDLVREPEAWDDARWRANEDKSHAYGRVRVGAYATHGDEVVAYTALGVSEHRPEAAYQWDTIVRADHRGHRLGLLLKVAALRQLPAGVRWISTWNAASNAHMIAINEQLGYRPVDTWTECQRDLV